MFELVWTAGAQAQYEALQADPSQKKRFKAVTKCLQFLRANPRHQGLHTHEWDAEKCSHGGKLYEAYAQNKTPGAFRVFFCYVPDLPAGVRVIEIFSITPHP
jgi:hypothetical protein